MITSLCLVNVFFAWFPIFPIFSLVSMIQKNLGEKTALTETHDMVVWANLFRSDLTGVIKDDSNRGNITEGNPWKMTVCICIVSLNPPQKNRYLKDPCLKPYKNALINTHAHGTSLYSLKTDGSRFLRSGWSIRRLGWRYIWWFFSHMMVKMCWR